MRQPARLSDDPDLVEGYDKRQEGYDYQGRQRSRPTLYIRHEQTIDLNPTSVTFADPERAAADATNRSFERHPIKVGRIKGHPPHAVRRPEGGSVNVSLIEGGAAKEIESSDAPVPDSE
jgi:hypothetical protein